MAATLVKKSFSAKKILVLKFGLSASSFLQLRDLIYVIKHDSACVVYIRLLHCRAGPA